MTIIWPLLNSTFVSSTSYDVEQYCDSVCLRLRTMARTQLHFPIAVGIGLTDFYPKKIPMGCEPHSGVSHRRAQKWPKLETRMADSGKWGFGEGAASSLLPPAREECCKLLSGIWGGAPENFDFLHSWDPQNVYLPILGYLKEQKFLGRLGGGPCAPSKYAHALSGCNTDQAACSWDSSRLWSNSSNTLHISCMHPVRSLQFHCET